MRLVIITMIAGFVQVSAASFGQKLSYTKKDASLREIFKQITLQTGYNVLYSPEKVEASKKLSVDFKNTDLKAVLEKLSDESFVYSIEDKNIIIKPKEPSFLDRVVDAFTPPVDISGLVLDEKGLPLPGVTVRVKGTNKATSTDNAGGFYLASVDDDAVIEFRMVGYKTLELSAKGKFEGLRMEVLSKELEEVVVAYGKTTQQALTGAVTVVKGYEIESKANSSFDRSLQGLVPGLLINSGSGQPGGGVSNFVLRGIGTGIEAGFGSTIRNPLIVIDGVPVTQDFAQSTLDRNTTPIMNPLAQINPNDIDEITVLKDASAIALYGTKASNGVILVTTKKGTLGKSSVQVRSQIDVASNLKNKIKLLDQAQYLTLLTDSYINSNSTLWNNASVLNDLYDKFPFYLDQDGNKTFYQSSDWNDELFDEAVSTSTDLSIQGGSEKSSHYLNLNYSNQNGTLKKTGFERTALRLNLTNNPLDWLNAGLNSTLSYSKQMQSNQIATGSNSNGFALTASPLLPNRLANGDYQYVYPYGTIWTPSSPAPNPVASRELNIANNYSYRALANIYGEISFLKKFKIKTNWGTDFVLSNEKLKVDPRLTDPELAVYSTNIGFVSDNAYIRYNLIGTNTLRYNDSFGKHDLDALLGQETQLFKRKSISGNASNFASPFYDQLSNGTSTYAYGDEYKETLTSYFFQASYSFDSKYYVTLSGRRDGSSKFGSRERYGNFGSVGVGWILSEERLLKNLTFLNYLKLRGSYGTSGSSNSIDAKTRFDLLAFRKYSDKAAVQASTSPGNPDIKWENTVNSDLGMEATILNKRLSFTIDIYKRKINDLIYTVNLPASTGYTQVVDNFGIMENKGIETSVRATVIQKSSINWDFTVNWSTNKNKLIKANFPQVASTYTINKEGENFESYFMPIWNGVNASTGHPQWIDNQGNSTSIYANAEKRIVGKPQPDGFGTLSNTLTLQKQFQLSFSLYYQYGFQVFDTRQQLLLNDGLTAYINQSAQTLDYWKAPGDNSLNPRRILNNADGGNSISTRYLIDGDFLRLQNVTLSYSFAHNLAKKLNLSVARIFLQGSNLTTWTKSPNAEPDNSSNTGITSFSYPQQRIFSFGINLTL